jgi:hypothetical protein
MQLLVTASTQRFDIAVCSYAFVATVAAAAAATTAATQLWRCAHALQLSRAPYMQLVSALHYSAARRTQCQLAATNST